MYVFFVELQMLGTSVDWNKNKMADFRAYKTKSLDGTKPNTNPKTNPNPNTNPIQLFYAFF